MVKSIGRWRTSARVLLFFILCPVLLAFLSPIDQDVHGLPPGMFIGVAASLGTLVLTVLFVRWDGIRLEDVGAAFSKRTPFRFLAGFAIGLLLVALHVSIEAFAGNLRWVRSDGVGLREIASTITLYILLASREELAFHGYPLRRLQSFLGLWVAQLIVALLFAAEHVAGGSTWMNALLGAGVGSLLFGMAAIATRGLAVPIGLHAAWNFGDWMHGGKGPGGFWHPIALEPVRAHADRTAMIGYVVVMVAGTLAFWWWHRQAQRDLVTGSPAHV